MLFRIFVFNKKKKGNVEKTKTKKLYERY